MLSDIQLMYVCGGWLHLFAISPLLPRIPSKSGCSIGICMLGTSEGARKAKRQRKSLGQGRTQSDGDTAGGDMCGVRSRCEVKERAGRDLRS